jgi:hypothetical protein
VFEQSLLKGYPRVAWVQAMVVFTNPDAVLQLRYATVPVVHVEELVGAIMTMRSGTTLPAPALTKIGLALLGMRDG